MADLAPETLAERREELEASEEAYVEWPVDRILALLDALAAEKAHVERLHVHADEIATQRNAALTRAEKAQRQRNTASKGGIALAKRYKARAEQAEAEVVRLRKSMQKRGAVDRYWTEREKRKAAEAERDRQSDDAQEYHVALHAAEAALGDAMREARKAWDKFRQASAENAANALLIQSYAARTEDAEAALSRVLDDMEVLADVLAAPSPMDGHGMRAPIDPDHVARSLRALVAKHREGSSDG